MTIKYASDGNPDGLMVGSTTTGKLGFYGTTPIVQPATTAQSAITAGATTTSANALLIEIRTALVNLGIIKGSA